LVSRAAKIKPDFDVIWDVLEDAGYTWEKVFNNRMFGVKDSLEGVDIVYFSPRCQSRRLDNTLILNEDYFLSGMDLINYHRVRVSSISSSSSSSSSSTALDSLVAIALTEPPPKRQKIAVSHIMDENIRSAITNALKDIHAAKEDVLIGRETEMYRSLKNESDINFVIFLLIIYL
jgi:hypothetical protein